MKTLIELFEEIESFPFACQLNVASGLRTLEGGLSLFPASKELAARVKSAEVREEVVRRSRTLIAAACGGKEPAADIALTVYLLLLSHEERHLAEQVVSELSPAPGWWWVLRVAERLSSPPATTAAPHKDSA